MPAQELPARPNLDQYKKRAKELVKAAKAGDARAFALMREHHPRLTKASLYAHFDSKDGLVAACIDQRTARLVGFADATAFLRAFKPWTGLRPREYVALRVPQA